MKNEIASTKAVSSQFHTKKMPSVLSESEKEPEFDWVQLHNEIHNQQSGESSQEKFLRKVKENPFVPIGIYTWIMQE